MAIEVHWKTGPGLIESVYAALKCLELDKPAFLYHAQVAIPGL
jgi:hypothetical protein